MSTLIKIFKKKGGFKLLKRYFKSGALFTAICQFILLGRSRTALEILELSASLKTKKKLEKKYFKVLKNFDKNYVEKEHKSSNIVWTCWFQGLENAPEIVKICHKSLENNLKDKKLVVITSENMDQYVKFPDYIFNKWKEGKISHTFLTDLLRLELLINYGGMWIDSTVLCTCSSSKIPSFYFDSDLFLYQNLKPGRNGNATYISSWLISAKTNNKLLMATRELCYEYWKTHDTLIDYFLIHQFMSIVFDYYEEDWKKIVPCNNATPHALLLRLFDNYDDNMWNYLINSSPFHKLSYKINNVDLEKENTYYKLIIQCFMQQHN